MAGLVVVAENVYRAEVKRLHSTGRGGTSGESWRCWCRVYVVHIVHIGVRNWRFGRVGGSPRPAVANGGIGGIVMLSYRNVGR